MTRGKSIVATVAALIGLASGVAAQTGPVVHAPVGAVRGVAADGEVMFKGIPYAIPPIGERRWRAPAPLPAWVGVRDATRFGAACPQPPMPKGSIYTDDYPAMSEDCLTLNVWALADARHAPVLVWVHGGALTIGSARESMFDGARLAKRGIVVVSINYRLGVLGFLAHPSLSAESPDGVSGNYGLLDQIAALRWVKANIAAFGGDPARVTIQGESGGGLSMVYLIASPLARGLFAQAIAESANMMSMPELKRSAFGQPSAESIGERVAVAAGAGDLATLRATDAMALVGAATKAGFVPTGTMDGHVFTRQLIDTYDRGEQARVPVLTGFNSGEIRSLRRLLGPPPADAVAYTAAIRARYGDLADTFLCFYPADDIDGSMLAATRDGLFGWTSQRLVRDQTRLGVPAYLYFFDHSYPAADAAELHGFHESEVPYVFGTIHTPPPLWPRVPDTAAEQRLSDTMVNYWASFVRTGTPAAPGAPTWRPFGAGGAYMLFTDTPHSATGLMDDRFRLHEQVICRRHAAGTQPWNWNIGVGAPMLPPATEGCR